MGGAIASANHSCIVTVMPGRRLTIILRRLEKRRLCINARTGDAGPVKTCRSSSKKDAVHTTDEVRIAVLSAARLHKWLAPLNWSLCNQLACVIGE